MKGKKLLAMGLAVVMSVGMLAGCGGNAGKTPSTQAAANAGGSSADTAAGDKENAGGTDAQTEFSGEVETIKMYCMSMGVASEYQNVVDAINEISVPEIGVKVDLTMLEIGQWFEQYSMLISGSESVDLMPSFSDAMPGGVNQGAFTELTDLLNTYGKDIYTYVPQKYIDAVRYSGQLYGIPSVNMYAARPCIEYNADVVEELGIDVSGVKTLADWESVLAQVKEAKPEMTPLAANAGNTMPLIGTAAPWTGIAKGAGVLMNDAETVEVVNGFATEEYRELLKLVESWNDKGYIATDAITETDTFGALAGAGKAFSTIASENLHYAEKETQSIGVNIGTIPLGDYRASTGAISLQWNIPITSEHPEAAMKFLNLMYSNYDVATLFAYGVEGVNYQVLEDGTATYVDGEDAQNCKYHPNIDWVLPGNYNTIVWNGNVPITTEEAQAFNESATFAPNFGFQFDSSTVQNQETACANVIAQYQVALELGSVDVDTVLPEFLTALEAAGVNDIIEEQNRQLQEWLSAQE